MARCRFRSSGPNRPHSESISANESVKEGVSLGRHDGRGHCGVSGHAVRPRTVRTRPRCPEGTKAVAAHFDVTIQSVWEPGAVILNDHELALLMNGVAAAKVAFAETYAEIQTAKE